MKIGYFTSAFPYKNPLTGEPTGSYIGGGVENVTYNLTIQMAKRGHDVSIFTSSIDSKSSIEYYGNITIYRYKSNFKIGQAHMSFGLIYKPVIADLDLDIVHSHMGNLPAPITAYLYAKMKKRPIIVTYHADWMGGFGGVIRRTCVFLFNNYLCDKLLSNSDLIIALSNHQVNESMFLKKYTGKIRAICNGINLNDFEIQLSKEECRNKLKLPADKNIILFVGSLTPRKGPQILIKSMEKIIEKIPNSYLVIVGDGYYRKEIENLACELNIDKEIKFVGFVDEKSKILYYKSADIFVLPSFHESFGIVLLEASACGLPLVVSDLEAFKAIIKEGYNGLSTKMGEDNDLANKLIYLLENDDVRMNMGKNAKDIVQSFSWERVADETENAYLNLTSENI